MFETGKKRSHKALQQVQHIVLTAFRRLPRESPVLDHAGQKKGDGAKTEQKQ
jgi:hypothetical protein